MEAPTCNPGNGQQWRQAGTPALRTLSAAHAERKEGGCRRLMKKHFVSCHLPTACLMMPGFKAAAALLLLGACCLGELLPPVQARRGPALPSTLPCTSILRP